MQHLLYILAISVLLMYCNLILISARPIMLNIGDGFGIDDEFYPEEGEANVDVDFDDEPKSFGFLHRYKDEENNVVSDLKPAVKKENGNMSFAPEYMLELYDKLSKSPTLHNSNIIRSFKNIPHFDGNSTSEHENFQNYRIHSLVFDISALSWNESIKSAELRLFTLIKRDQRSYIGVSRLVSLYEVLDISETNSKKSVKYNFITSRFIYSIENAWETFGVTDSVKKSLHHGLRIARFEIRIQSLYTGSANDNMDIIEDPNDMKQPILVVYSNDNSKEHENNVERHELILHELERSPGPSASTESDIDRIFSQHSRGLMYSREKRSRAFNKGSFCKRRPLFINFEDIGWHSWIIAPRGYQAYQCAGKCTFPLSDHLSPSKHAIIQTLMHTIDPKRTARSCCVPTKLDPISILYVDEQGVVTYKYRYDGMVVAECGCR